MSSAATERDVGLSRVSAEKREAVPRVFVVGVMGLGWAHGRCCNQGIRSFKGSWRVLLLLPCATSLCVNVGLLGVSTVKGKERFRYRDRSPR